MFRHIDPRSPLPIYAQISSRVRLAIAAGELCAGDPLPSVRVLAAQLRVNPATVVQAYRDLENDGVVDVRQGSGTYVAQLTPERKSRAREQEARRLVRNLLEQAARLSISPSELKRAIDAELGRGGNHA
ncbi:MAG TPA: GntR family transcriptional regulator [Gemmatimonadaceae bacterium]